MSNGAQWVVLSAVGLTAGVAAALVLGGPLQAIVGMMLVTPMLTALVGAVLGTAQWLPLRARAPIRASSWILATTVGLVLHGAMYGPQAAFFAEQFPTRVRYTGLSVGGQLSSIAAGAVAPLVAVALFQSWHSTVPVSLYVVAMCVLTVLALSFARETRGSSLRVETPEERSVDVLA